MIEKMFGKKDAISGELEGELAFLNDKIRVNKPKTYEEIRDAEHEEIKQSRHAKALELFMKAIEYNTKNGKKTDIHVDEATFLSEYLDTLSEEKLYEVYDLLNYAHDPLCPNCKISFPEGTKTCEKCETPLQRLIITIPDHKSMEYISALLKKAIPGFDEQLRINKLLKEKELAEMKIKDLEEVRDTKRREHKQRIETTSTITRMPKLEDPKADFMCTCGKDCKNAGGLASHQNHCEQYKNSQK